MNTNDKVLLALLAVVVGAIIFCNCKSKKEGYKQVFFNPELNTITNASFNSNLDPKNLNMRFDSTAYSGHTRGSAPEQDMLAFSASQNKEGFGIVTNPQNDSTSISNVNQEYTSIPDFSYLGSEGTEQQKLQANKKWKATSSTPNTLDYTLPSELLPQQDLRNTTSTRDPTDPTNFMYTRSLTSNLKKRNHNESDRFRGDLDISPIRSGLWDVSMNQNDLVKGYFGYYTDIQGTSDLQDVVFSHARDGDDPETSSQKLSTFLSKLNADMLKPNLAYGKPTGINHGNLQSQYTTSNPWYDSVNKVGKSDYNL
jgi:hypothetical protein